MVKRLKLLILNASSTERRIIRATLECLEIFQFIEASDSQDALKILKQQTVNIVITSLDVGKIDGWRFSRMIRSGLLKTPKNTPILVISPIYCERIAETTARSYGIDAVLPFERQDTLPQVLANVLASYLEKSSRLNLLLLEPVDAKASEISEQLQLNFAITHVTSSDAALKAYNQQQFAIVLLNATATRAKQSSALVKEILQLKPMQAIVTIIDSNDADYAEQLLLSGVTDFIRTPYAPSFLNTACDHAARREDFMVSYAEFANKVEQLSLSEIRYRELFSAHQRILLHLNTVVLELDQQGLIHFINPAWEALTGYAVNSTLQQSLTTFFTLESQQQLQKTIDDILRGGEHKQQVEIKLLHKNGLQVWVDCRLQLINNSRNNSTITATIDNINERKEAETRLRYLALHDTLTGLHNRYYFDQQLTHICQTKYTHSDIEHTLIYIDLDHFKIINDSKGHQQGDSVLKEVAQLFNANISHEHLVCRVGGDEFAIILKNTPLSTAHIIAQEICSVIEKNQFKSEGQIYSISCSIGVTQINALNCDPNECLKQADIALYIAKSLGRNLVHCYKKQDIANNNLQTGLEWGHGIRQALQQDNIELHYQPIWDFSTNKVAYFEALLRLKVGDELVYPNQFIPSLEMLNDTFLMDQCVIRNTIANVAKHSELSQVAINLSAQSFLDERLLPLIESNLAKYQVSPTRIIFEITESTSMNSLAATRKMIEKLNSLGCHFSIDDFGTGFSTFNYLKQLPAQHVKIDGSFVRDMLNDPIDLALVKAINDISRSLNKHSVAEFVETAEIFFALKELGIDYGQGFFIARPVPIEKVQSELNRIIKNKKLYQQSPTAISV